MQITLLILPILSKTLIFCLSSACWLNLNGTRTYHFPLCFITLDNIIYMNGLPTKMEGNIWITSSLKNHIVSSFFSFIPKGSADFRAALDRSQYQNQLLLHFAWKTQVVLQENSWRRYREDIPPKMTAVWGRTVKKPNWTLSAPHPSKYI